MLSIRNWRRRRLDRPRATLNPFVGPRALVITADDAAARRSTAPPAGGIRPTRIATSLRPPELPRVAWASLPPAPTRRRDASPMTLADGKRRRAARVALGDGAERAQRRRGRACAQGSNCFRCGSRRRSSAPSVARGAAEARSPSPRSKARRKFGPCRAPRARSPEKRAAHGKTGPARARVFQARSRDGVPRRP